jgi:hypothetical protein
MLNIKIKTGNFIISCDLDLAYPDLDYTGNTKPNKHLWIILIQSLYSKLQYFFVHTHIFKFLSDLIPFKCDLNLGYRDWLLPVTILPHSSEHLCQIILKSLNICRSFPLKRCFTFKSKCNFDLWPRDLVHMQVTTAYVSRNCLNTTTCVGDMFRTKLHAVLPKCF